MIKAINNAEGLEVAKPNKDIIVLIGHFGKESFGRIPIFAKDAPGLFDGTNPKEFHMMHEGKNLLVGIVDWKPQGTEIMFTLHGFAIDVDSDEFKQEVERVLAS